MYIKCDFYAIDFDGVIAKKDTIVHERVAFFPPEQDYKSWLDFMRRTNNIFEIQTWTDVDGKTKIKYKVLETIYYVWVETPEDIKAICKYFTPTFDVDSFGELFITTRN